MHIANERAVEGVRHDLSPIIGRLPLFEGVQGPALERIARGSRELRVEKGSTIFHRGDACTGFHLILSGQVKLAFTSADGGEKVVEVLGRGQTFGEAVMFMERPYIVSAQAVSDASLIHVGKNVIFEEIERDPKFARKMIAGLAMRLHHLMQDLESVSLRSGKQRVIGYLLREVPEADFGSTGVTVVLSISKGTIASRLNLTSEHFSRVLNELSSTGLLVVKGRSIHIPDVARLQAYAD